MTQRVSDRELDRLVSDPYEGTTVEAFRRADLAPKLAKELLELRAENARLREALKFYANGIHDADKTDYPEEPYFPGQGCDWSESEFRWIENGNVARGALSAPATQGENVSKNSGEIE